MEIPFPSLNVNMTEMNEDRMARKLDEDYARRVDALSRVDVFRALDAEIATVTGHSLFLVQEYLNLINLFGLPPETEIAKKEGEQHKPR